MGKKKKIKIPIRDGKPAVCVVCGESLHRKSEYYCSQQCAERQSIVVGEDAIPFLSKWKIRKRKGLQDPSIKVRQNTRRKTSDLIKKGKLKGNIPYPMKKYKALQKTSENQNGLFI